MNMRLIFCLISVLFSILLQMSPVIAGDEDMNPSVYQQFDPETGFMVPVDPKTMAQHGKHSPVQDPASTVNRSGNSAQVQGQPTRTDPSTIWVGGFIGLTLFGGFILWIRKYRQNI